MSRIIPFLVLTILLLASCDEQAEPELTTTTTTEVETTTTTGAGTTTTTASTTTIGEGTSQPSPPIEEYEIAVRSSTDQGEVLWLVISPGDYEGVTLEGLVARVREEVDPPVWEIHVFDDRQALDAARVAAEDRTEEEQALVSEHYLVSYVEGSVLRFQGPYEELGEYVLGS